MYYCNQILTLRKPSLWIQRQICFQRRVGCQKLRLLRKPLKTV